MLGFRVLFRVCRWALAFISPLLYGVVPYPADRSAALLLLPTISGKRSPHNLVAEGIHPCRCSSSSRNRKVPLMLGLTRGPTAATIDEAPEKHNKERKWNEGPHLSLITSAIQAVCTKP